MYVVFVSTHNQKVDGGGNKEATHTTKNLCNRNTNKNGETTNDKEFGLNRQRTNQNGYEETKDSKEIKTVDDSQDNRSSCSLFTATKILRDDTVAVGRIVISRNIPVSTPVSPKGKSTGDRVVVGSVRLSFTHGVGTLQSIYCGDQGMSLKIPR